MPELQLENQPSWVPAFRSSLLTLALAPIPVPVDTATCEQEPRPLSGYSSIFLFHLFRRPEREQRSACWRYATTPNGKRKRQGPLPSAHQSDVSDPDSQNEVSSPF